MAMPKQVLVRDETIGVRDNAVIELEVLQERTTARELIRARVYQEVREHNARRALQGRMLVPPPGTEVVPTDTERQLNGPSRRERQRLDWEAQLARALRGFERNAFLILVDDRQVERLDEEFLVTPDTSIAFLRLVPLAGG